MACPRMAKPILFLVFASAVGGLLGILEGAVYPDEGGPRIPLLHYWTTLAVTLFVCLFAFASLVEPRPRASAFRAAALIPITVVVQDAVSLLLQGSSPAEATWYAAVFGDSLLTRQTGIAPGFYFVFAAASACMMAATHVLEPSKKATLTGPDGPPARSLQRQARRRPRSH